jgi:hypothetical protein
MIRTTLFLAVIFLGTVNAKAVSLETAAGFTELDNPSFHYLSYRGSLGFGGANSNEWLVHFGFTHPYEAHEYNQVMLRAGFTREWQMNVNSSVSFFGGIGAGGYMDRVWRDKDSNGSLIPSVIFRAGAKWGGKNFGLVSSIEDYNGIFNVFHLPWTIWFQYSATIGAYFAL